MAGFMPVAQPFLRSKLVKFWWNFARNFDGEVEDGSFFDVTTLDVDDDAIIDIVKAVCTDKEVKWLQDGHSGGWGYYQEVNSHLILADLWNNSETRGKCRRILGNVKNYMEGLGRRGPTDDVLERRFAEVKRAIGLSDLECEILAFAYVREYTCFAWPHDIATREKPLYYAMALDRSYDEILKAMSPRCKLWKFSLLSHEYDFVRNTLGGFMDGVTDDAIERQFYTKGGDEDVLPWAFYGDLASKDGELIKRIIKSSAGGCNILLYGAPGTGKTSFARSIAKEVGREAFEICQDNGEGRYMDANARMVGIHVCNAQENPGKSLMIVDEADELLRGTPCDFDAFWLGFGGGKSTEKSLVNSMLDNMRMPAIWISNVSADEMDESVRRRFDYSVCFERLNHAQRVAIWRNQVAKHGLEAFVSDAKIDEYASRYETSAGGISTVLANVKRMVSKGGNMV